MKIVIATPILHNETSPFNHLFKDIIGGFLEDGNQIIRLVACENKKETAFKYGYEGANIDYRLYKRKKSGHSNIFSRYIIDTFTNIRQALGILRMKDADVLFEDVSYSSFWPVLAAKIRGLRVVAMLQDVWPDNAVQSQLIKKDSILYKYFEWWQRSVYKNADSIICISDDMKEFIANKGFNRDKIKVIYNWGYSDDMVNIPWSENEFVKKYNLNQDKFYVVYAGNIGKMQNVELLVKAATHLQGNKDIHFLIIGEGARKNEILHETKDLKNVTILPFQPQELAMHIYSMADINLVPLVENGVRTALPSKIGVVLLCGRPAIYTFGEESIFGKLVSQYHAGATVSATDSLKLATAIEETILQERDEKMSGAFELYKKYFSRSNNIKKYALLIKGVDYV